MSVLYFIVSFLASIVGAISGIGGGVIIKPVLDGVGSLDVGSISFLSGNTVLAMTVVTLVRHRKTDVRVNRKISTLLALGGASGGLGGKFLFDMVRQYFGNDQILGAAQSIILVLLSLFVLFFTLFKQRVPSYNWEGTLSCLSTGVLLGGLASFLGIGGGPLNLAILYLLFSMDSKTAALNSIFIIFVSQLTNLFFTIIQGRVPPFPPALLALMMLGGITGGMMGSHFSRRMTHRHIDYLFIAVLSVIAALSSVNFIHYSLGSVS